MGIVRRSFVAVWPLRLGAIVVGLGPGRVLLVARLGAVPPSRAAGGCWGRGVAGLREADVLRQRRRLRALEQRREPRDQRGAGDRSGGEPRDVLPADPSAASHRGLQPRTRARAPPGRYSRPPLWQRPSNREYELVLMLDPEIPDERREQIAAEARQRIESGGDAQARHLVGHAQARLRDPPAHRGRLPLLPLRDAERACSTSSTTTCGSPTASCASGSSRSTRARPRSFRRPPMAHRGRARPRLRAATGLRREAAAEAAERARGPRRSRRPRLRAEPEAPAEAAAEAPQPRSPLPPRTPRRPPSRRPRPQRRSAEAPPSPESAPKSPASERAHELSLKPLVAPSCSARGERTRRPRP